MPTLRELILKGLSDQQMPRKDLADAIGLDTAVSVSKWIRPRRPDPVPWRHWKRLCRVLGIPWSRWYRVAKRELPVSAHLYDKYLGR